MKKVLIMTPDIEGPVRNGGIGTAFTALATTLAKKGYDVDVLYTCGDYSESSASTFSDWSRIYSRLILMRLILEEKVTQFCSG